MLGGGLVKGSLILVGGEPGVGKSTLLLQALLAMGAAGVPTLLVSGEESAAQVKLRARRLSTTFEGLSSGRGDAAWSPWWPVWRSTVPSCA